MMLPALSAAMLDSAAVQVTRAQPAWLWMVEGGVAVTIALALIVLLGASVIVVWRLKQAFDRLGSAVERLRADVQPVTERAVALAGHLESAAASVHDAVDEVTATILGANEVLQNAVATADERFREFDAIVRVARDEAEDAVVGAASVVRGVRGGVSAFRRRGAGAYDPAAADPVRDDEPAAPPRRRNGGPRVRRARARDEE